MDSKDKKNHKNKTYVAAFEFAFQGIKTAFLEERNVRSHFYTACVAIPLGFLFRLSRWEWLWLLLAIFLVIIMEIVNTAFENVVDMVTNYHFHVLGKKIKDMAAGAVMITAIFAFLVGTIIFLPKIFEAILLLLGK